MELQLTAEEGALLQRLLVQAVSDLKMEITDTENYDWRQDMKRDEATLKSIVDRLRTGGEEQSSGEVIIVVEETVVEL